MNFKTRKMKNLNLYQEILKEVCPEKERLIESREQSLIMLVWSVHQSLLSNKTLNENSSNEEIKKIIIKEFKEKEIIKKPEHESYIGITPRGIIEPEKAPFGV